MKITRRLMGFAAALMALTACSESEDMLSAFHSDPNAVRITAEVGKASADGFTRSNPLGDAKKQTEFNENDEISVKADGQEAVTYKLVGTEWQPQGGKFLKWESQTMNFTAYYPATYTGGPITQPTEYSSEDDLAAADYMSYSGQQSNTNGNNLTLTMNRLMARVVVEVVGFNDQYAQNTNVNSISINGVKAYRPKDGNKFYALIKPCEAQTGVEFLSLEVGENNAKETLTGIPALEAGKSYTYQLTVGKNKVKVNGVTVADWNTTDEIAGGKAEYIPYVTFTAEGEQGFKMTVYNGYTISGLEYSVNYGEWTKVVADAEVPFGGDKGNLRLRGKNENGTKLGSGFANISFSNSKVKVDCYGDIRTLLNWANYKTVDTSKAGFRALFSGCQVLTSAPDLPTMTLGKNCYKRMFADCTALVKAPELPAKILAESCYFEMFAGCSALEKAPTLPAETLAKGCYNTMFNGCTSLVNAPALPATTMAENCYREMFRGCTALVNAPALPAETLANYCYESMFSWCTSLVNAPKLSATKLATDCYIYMFDGCTQLSTVTMLAPSTEETTENSGFFSGWLKNAGTKATSRTLQLNDKTVYDALNEKGNLPDNWKIGSEGTTVLDASGNQIVE